MKKVRGSAGRAPASRRRRSTSRFSSGRTPRPPAPSGKCTHASPASNWAPRKSTAASPSGRARPGTRRRPHRPAGSRGRRPSSHAPHRYRSCGQCAPSARRGQPSTVVSSCGRARRGRRSAGRPPAGGGRRRRPGSGRRPARQSAPGANLPPPQRRSGRFEHAPGHSGRLRRSQPRRHRRHPSGGHLRLRFVRSLAHRSLSVIRVRAQGAMAFTVTPSHAGFHRSPPT